MAFAPAPSNYKALPRVPRTDGPPATPHDRYLPDRVTGTIDLRFDALDPVRVGTGVPYVVGEGDRAALAHDLSLHQGRPTLPGSSLKGAIRSLCEALGGGCDDPTQCGRVPCVTCALFGYVRGQETWAGRVGFDDAVAKTDATVGLVRLPRAFPPKVQVGRRAYGAAPQGAEARVPYLAAGRGTSFFGRLILENVAPAELGLVLLALGQDGTFVPRVGGGKFFGLGRVRVALEGGRLRDGHVARRRSAAEIGAEVPGWLAALPVDPRRDPVLTVLRAQMGVR